MPVTPEQARAELARRRQGGEGSARNGPMESRSAARRLIDAESEALRRDGEYIRSPAVPSLEEMQSEEQENYVANQAAGRQRLRLGPVDVAPFVDPIATEENRTDSARGLRRGWRGLSRWAEGVRSNGLMLEGRDALPPMGPPAPVPDEEFERYAGQSIADEIVIAPSAQDRDRRNREQRAERRTNTMRGIREGAGAVSDWAQQQSLERPWLSPQDAMLAEAGEVTFDFLREPWRAYERGAQARDEARFEGREDDAADQALANIGQSSLAALSVWPGSRAVRAGGGAAARGLRALPGAVRDAGARVARPRLPAAARETAETSGRGEFRTMMGIDPTQPLTPRQRRLRSANPEPARAGNDDTLGWLATGGAWTTAGALAASNDARASEAGGAGEPPLELTQAREAVLQQQERLRRFEDLSARAANDPSAARELQAIIGAVPDSRYGPQTATAARTFGAQIRADMEESERRRQSLEESYMLERLSLTPEEEAQRELLLASSAGAGALVGKYGLPIPRSIPFLGRFSGALGRSGTARHVRDRLGERVARAEAVPFNERPFGRRSLNQDQRAAERAASANDFWREGLESGDQARVPFRLNGATQRPQANRNARSASELFQPPRFSGEDYGYMAMGGLDAGIAGAMLPGAQQQLEDAELAFQSERTDVNFRAVEEARANVTRLEIALRAGIGYIGGRVVGGYTDHYAGAPRPRNLRAAEAEQGRIGRYVAPAEPRGLSARPRRR